MSAKHTPGPWKYDPKDGSLDSLSDVAVGRFHSGRDDMGSDMRPRKADARLIAAAPELLAALEGVIAWAIEHEEGSAFVANVRKPIEFEKARAALAKARGES